MQAVAKALGDLASDVCPLRDVALSTYLGKLLTQLKRCLQVRSFLGHHELTPPQRRVQQ